MSNLRTKIWAWAKAIVFGAALVYVVLFALYNSGKAIAVWLFFGRTSSVSLLVLILVSFAAGVALTLIWRAVRKTVNQIQEMRSRARAARMERDLADVKAKAAMLQQKTN